MEYTELKIKIPKPTRTWFRFSIRTLLVLTLLVAIGVVCWRAYSEWQVTNSVRARDAALWNWRQVHSAHQQGGSATAAAEVRARELYFERRAAVKNTAKSE